MRIIRVRSQGSDRTWIWVATGAVLGLAAGVVVAERMSGRRPRWRQLARRGRDLARTALSTWGPLLEAARSLRDVWEERGDGGAWAFAGEAPARGRRARARDEEDEIEDDEDLEEDADEQDVDGDALDDEEFEDEELEDEELEDEELEDEELEDEELEDEELEDEELEDEEDLDVEDLDDEDEAGEPDDAEALDARVLEAFANDPILAHRAIEIEEVDAGRIVLHGRVRSAKEVARAVTLARGVPGVERVRERLTVRARPR